MDSNRKNGMDSLKSGHVPILQFPLDSITPSPENDELYRPVRNDDPEVVALAKSIEERGILEPLSITRDRYIVSGHRRYAAARLAGLKELPCRCFPFLREGNPDFVRLLREANLQRVKTRDERLREEIISVDPEEAYRSLTEHRERASRVDAETIGIRDDKIRALISEAKKPFLDTVQSVIARLKKFWPLSDRQIHYQLLNEPPLIHASKPGSVYRNNLKSYKALSDLLTRARHEGLIPYEVIADATRPVTIWKVFPDSGTFTREQLNGLLKGYWRDLTQSQPNHIEIVGEKLTIQEIIRPVAAHYCIPMTIGRGYCSTRPKHDIVERYKASGKKRLIVLVISDFDPDGEEIAHSLIRSLRDDFQVCIEAVKVALDSTQVAELDLPPSLKAKETSTNYDRFVKRHGTEAAYELEALEPETLQRLLREAIESVLDMDAFEAEIAAEKEDAAHLEAVRRRALNSLREDQEGA